LVVAAFAFARPNVVAAFAFVRPNVVAAFAFAQPNRVAAFSRHHDDNDFLVEKKLNFKLQLKIHLVDFQLVIGIKMGGS
jgi:hypothetical protein